MRAGEGGGFTPPAPLSPPSPRAVEVRGGGASPTHLLSPRKTGHWPVSLPNATVQHHLGSQRRQCLPRGRSHLHVVPALGPLSGFLVPLQGQGGTCLISAAELSRLRGMGLVAGVLQGSEAPENLGLKITVGDSR